MLDEESDDGEEEEQYANYVSEGVAAYGFGDNTYRSEDPLDSNEANLQGFTDSIYSPTEVGTHNTYGYGDYTYNAHEPERQSTGAFLEEMYQLEDEARQYEIETSSPCSIRDTNSSPSDLGASQYGMETYTGMAGDTVSTSTGSRQSSLTRDTAASRKGSGFSTLSRPFSRKSTKSDERSSSTRPPVFGTGSWTNDSNETSKADFLPRPSTPGLSFLAEREKERRKSSTASGASERRKSSIASGDNSPAQIQTRSRKTSSAHSTRSLGIERPKLTKQTSNFSTIRSLLGGQSASEPVPVAKPISDEDMKAFDQGAADAKAKMEAEKAFLGEELNPIQKYPKAFAWMGNDVQKEDMAVFAKPPPPNKEDGQGFLAACQPGFVIQAENASGRLIYVNIIIPAYVEKGDEPADDIDTHVNRMESSLGTKNANALLPPPFEPLHRLRRNACWPHVLLAPCRYETEQTDSSAMAKETHMLNVGASGEIYREKRSNSRFAYDPYADQLCLYDVIVHPSVYHFIFKATDGRKELFCKRVLQHINKSFEESFDVNNYTLPNMFKGYKGEMHVCYIKRSAFL
jgi:hypothetical protein